MKRLALFLACLAPLGVAAILQQAGEPVETDRIAELQKRLASGQTTLAFEPKQGYLRSLLKELKISPDSQTLVFSKTSIQSDFISPKNPRALYFNDDTYVGWIPGAPLIEIMAVHPKQGVMFYTMPNRATEATFKKETTDCFRCHGGFRANQSPGLMARSSPVGPSGYPRPFAPTFTVTHESPLKERWGGWYVTGTHGNQRHMGNELAEGTDERYHLNTERGANVTKLDRYFNTKDYLTPHSDIVALMVMEHQMEVQNTLTRVSRNVQNLLRRTDAPDEIARVVEPLVEALLCKDEAKLTAPVKGTSSFAKTFAATAPADTAGRSFSQLDLTSRVFKFSFSTLVYSKSFDALPDSARAEIWKRLSTILTGTSEYSNLSVEKKTAIKEILRDTKPEFARHLTSH